MMYGEMTSARRRSLSGRAVNVLLVEDNPADARLARELLDEAELHPFQLIHTERLADALPVVRERPIDVVLLDLTLPDVTGLDTVHRFQAHAPEVPIVVFSGMADEALAVRAVQDGVQDYLLKGAGDARAMARSIRYAIERKRSETELRDRAGELEAIVSVSAALRQARTSEEMLPPLLEKATEVVDAALAAVYLRDDEGNALVLRGCHPPRPALIGRAHGKDRGLTGRAATTSAAHVSNLRRDNGGVSLPADEALLVSDIETCVALPLRTQERQVGVLLVGRGVPHAFDGADLNLLTAVAEIAGNALHRARLTETLEQRVADRTRALAAANHRLKDLDQLKSKFISDVSHELRTPVTNMGLYLHLLQRGSPEKQERYLEVLHDQLGRLSHLIEDILDVSRLDLDGIQLEREPTDLNGLVADVVERFRARADAAGLTLSVAGADNLPLVAVDRERLEQVVGNLVSNGLSYTTSGEVRVSTTFDRAAGRVRVRVADSGMGIADEDRPHVFERFYRGRRASQSDIPGTGLGLAICKEIVQAHGGTIAVDSVPDLGSTFDVWLPATEADVAKDAAA